MYQPQRRYPSLWVYGLALFALLGCGSDATGPKTSALTHIRVINALFQDNTTDSTHVAIDYLIDSSVVAPSFFNIPAGGISVGDSANGYVGLPSGPHGLLARRAGDTTLAASLYTTSSNQPYIPILSFSSGAYTTIVVAGIVPATGSIATNTIPVTVIADDPFPGPMVNQIVQARFRVINAAPYSSSTGRGATATVYVTPGDTIPTNPSFYTPLGTAGYRGASAYINVDPGTYVVTIVASNATVAQQVISFGAGNVRTLVLQSIASGVPSLANHTLVNLLDHQYSE